MCKSSNSRVRRTEGGGWSTNKFIYEFLQKHVLPNETFTDGHTTHKVQLPLHTMSACKDDRQDDTTSMTAVVVITPAVSPHQTGSQVTAVRGQGSGGGMYTAVVQRTSGTGPSCGTNKLYFCPVQFPHVHSVITYLWTLIASTGVCGVAWEV